jgi:glycosyltransferase involved in cell wall biosynthesis
MRVGQNPAKSLKQVAHPAEITAAVTTYIPFTSGYYEQSLDVLKLSLESMRTHADRPFDLMVFDNASCEPVREYLLEAQKEGKIQYLILSEENMGVIGAWNVLFGAAPGEYIFYSDYDIYFYPNWTSALIEVLEAFPQAGMVTGLPLFTPVEFSTSTVEWAKGTRDVELIDEEVISFEDVWRHGQSIGLTRTEVEKFIKETPGYQVFFKGKRCNVGAGHFQFAGRKAYFLKVIPLQAERPMGGEVRNLDIAINDAGFLRLSTPDWHVEHMGNAFNEKFSLSAPRLEQTVAPASHGKIKMPRIVQVKFIRRILEFLYNRIFRILHQ